MHVHTVYALQTVMARYGTIGCEVIDRTGARHFVVRRVRARHGSQYDHHIPRRRNTCMRANTHLQSNGHTCTHTYRPTRAKCCTQPQLRICGGFTHACSHMLLNIGDTTVCSRLDEDNEALPLRLVCSRCCRYDAMGGPNAPKPRGARRLLIDGNGLCALVALWTWWQTKISTKLSVS